MRTKLLSLLLFVTSLLAAALLTVPAKAETASLSAFTFTVAKNPDSGLDGDVLVSFTGSGSSYSGTLYLPGSADESNLFFSWDNATVKSESTALTSGSAAVPANGESITYTVIVSGSSGSFTVKTVKGSEGVKGMFFTIDESRGTISDMEADRTKNKECFGSVTYKNNTYYDVGVKSPLFSTLKILYSIE